MRLQVLALLPILILSGCKENEFWIGVDATDKKYFTTVQSGDTASFDWDLNSINKSAGSNVVAAEISPLIGPVSVAGPAQPTVTFSNFYHFEGQTAQGARYNTNPVEVVALHNYCNENDVSLKLDMWVPNTPAPAQGYPAVVAIHGGGWNTGEYSDLYQLPQALSQAGFVTVTIEYRLSEGGGSSSPVGLWPTHIQDAKCAVRWLRNQNLVAVDRNRIGATGLSAGAHLALMLGVTDQSNDATATQLINRYRQTMQYTDTDDSVQAVASVAGPTDLWSTWQQLTHVIATGGLVAKTAAGYALAGLEALFPNNPPKDSVENQSLFTQNSPLFFLDADTAARVPFLVLHGDEDYIVPLEDGCKFARKVTSFAGDVTVLRYEGANTSHFSYFTFRSPNAVVKAAPGYGKQSERTLQDLVSFFKAHLQAEPVEPHYSTTPITCS